MIIVVLVAAVIDVAPSGDQRTHLYINLACTHACTRAYPRVRACPRVNPRVRARTRVYARAPAWTRVDDRPRARTRVFVCGLFCPSYGLPLSICAFNSALGHLRAWTRVYARVPACTRVHPREPACTRVPACPIVHAPEPASSPSCGVFCPSYGLPLSICASNWALGLGLHLRSIYRTQFMTKNSK